MENISRNTKIILSDKGAVFWGLVAAASMLLLGFMITDFKLLKGNLGATYMWMEIVLHLLLSILFGIFIMTHIYKYRVSWVNIKNKTTWLFWMLLGIIVTGCPACSVTLAAYLGLAWLIASLPFHGIEVKVVGIILLAWAQYMAVKDLMVCKMKKKK